MKIAIFASAFYPSLGGVEELVRQLAHQYQSKDIDPIILTNRWPRDLPAFENYEGLPIHRFAARIPEGNFKVRLMYQLTHQTLQTQVDDILRNHGTELLHIECVSSSAHYAVAAKHNLKIPLVVTLQGELTMDATRLYERSAFARSLMRSALTEADAITACSGQTLAEAESFMGTPFGSRGSVTYNGVNLKDFENVTPYSHPRPYILGIGRFVPQKGFDILLKAFSASQARETHDLILAGDGTEREALEKLSQELGLTEKVHFVGRAARPQAVQLFLGSSFFVLPSRHEPLGIVNLEAMAAGKAVVVSRVGGVPELVTDNENGLIVPPADSESMAKALTRLAQDSSLRDRLGATGKERVRRFDWPAVADQYIDLYQQVLSNSSSVPSVKTALSASQVSKL